MKIGASAYERYNEHPDHVRFVQERWLAEVTDLTARSTVPWIRAEAREAFLIAVQQRSPWPRAMAFAGLGAAEMLRASAKEGAAAELLADAATVIGVPGADPEWVWPERELTYANPALAEVVIAAGDLLGDEALLTDGLRMLAWLCHLQEHQGHLSTVPVGGWRPDVPKHRHDQQPIETAATADACATAAAGTGRCSSPSRGSWATTTRAR